MFQWLHVFFGVLWIGLLDEGQQEPQGRGAKVLGLVDEERGTARLKACSAFMALKEGLRRTVVVEAELVDGQLHDG